GTSAGRMRKGMPRLLRISARRGEAEARTSGLNGENPQTPRLWIVPADRPRLQARRLDLYLGLAPLVLARVGVGPVVGQQVLAAEILVDLLVDALEVLRRVDVERLASGDLRDLVELVLDLEVGARDPQPDRVDREAGLAHVLEQRVVVELRRRVLAVGQ